MHTKPNPAEKDTRGRNAAPEPPAIAEDDGALSRTSGEFRNFLTDIEDLIKATISLTGDDLARARARLNARVIAAKESVEEMSGVIADQARSAAGTAKDYVRGRPWQAIGIGATLGLLVGFAIARRR